MKNIINVNTFFLCLKVFSLNLITFTGGTALAWSSPYLPRLNGNVDPQNNPLEVPIGSQEGSLLASLINIGIFFGPFLATRLSDKYGRKLSIILCAIPIYASYWIIAFAAKLWQFYLARVLAGLTIGSIYSIIPIYVAELSEKHNRGALTCVLVISSSLGNLFIYIIGSYLTIKISSLIVLIPSTMFYVLVFVFLPESPYYLISKGENKKAEIALQSIRNKNKQTCTMVEFEEIKLSVNKSKENRFQLKEFIKNRESMRRLFIPSLLVFFQQFSGFFAVIFYLQTIFREAQVNLSPEINNIIIGCVQLTAALISPLIIDTLGRRILLFMSGVGSTITLILLAIFFYLKESNYDHTHLNWLPIFSLVIYVISYYVGFGPVPLTILGEIFDQKSKGFAATFVISIGAIFMFITTTLFPYLISVVGYSLAFLFFVIFTVTGLFYVYYFVPETKGKSLYDIQK